MGKNDALNGTSAVQETKLYCPSCMSSGVAGTFSCVQVLEDEVECYVGSQNF